MTTIKVVDPDAALAELARRTRIRGALMDLLWVRHGEPERIAPGTGVPRRSRAHRRWARAGAAARRLARVRADRRGARRARMRRAVETAAPIAAALGLEVEVVDGLIEYDSQLRPLHPDGGAAASTRTSAAPRWSKAAGTSSAPTCPTCSARASTRPSTDDRRSASPGKRVAAVCHGGVINVALGLGARRRATALVRAAATRRCRACSRRAAGSDRSGA